MLAHLPLPVWTLWAARDGLPWGQPLQRWGQGLLFDPLDESSVRTGGMTGPPVLYVQNQFAKIDFHRLLTADC